MAVVHDMYAECIYDVLVNMGLSIVDNLEESAISGEHANKKTNLLMIKLWKR